MFEKSKLILSPLLSLLFLITGTSFFMTFMTVRLQTEGASEWVIGGMHSAFYGGLFIGAFIIERGIREVGHIRVFAATASLTSASIIVMGLSNDPYVWIVARFIAGFCIAAHFVTIESWLLALSSVFDRGRILAIYMIGYYTAQAASQYLINFVNIEGAEPFLVSAFFVSVSIIPVTSTRKPQPFLHDLSKFTLFYLFKLSPFGFIGCFLSGMLISCIYGFTPAYAVAHNLPIATLMAVTILGGVVLQWPFGKASDFFDRRIILLSLGFFLMFPSLGILFFQNSQNAILALSFLMGGIIYTLYPLSLSQVCDRVGHSDLVGVTGLLLIVYGIGSTLGPLTAPLFMIGFETEGLFIYYAFISVVMTIVGIIAIILHKPVKLENQQEYVPLTGVTAVAYELDPRSEEG